MILDEEGKRVMGKTKRKKSRIKDEAKDRIKEKFARATGTEK